MQYSAILLATLASVTSAQVVYNSTTGVFSCPTVPNGVYCAGDSLSTNIILRCVNGTAHPGNCNDNLAGYFPYGVQPATCYQPDATSGTAACAKNCIVQGGSGNSPTFTLPNCTPIVESSTTSTPTPTPTPSTTTASTSASTTVTSTGTSTYVVDSTTITETFTTTYCPESTTSAPATTSTVAPTTTIPIPLSTFSTLTSIPLSTGGSVTIYSNGTTTAGSTSAGGSQSTSATAVPVGPTKTGGATTPGYTGGAMANSAGMGLSVVGLFIAYFL